MFSGGANGADLFWGVVAKEVGHKIIHYSFKGHKPLSSLEETVVLNQDELNLGDTALVEANKTIKRTFPAKSEHTNNLLRRNYWQIRESDALYGVGFIDNGEVKGGTAWAIVMYVNRKHNDNVYFLNQIDGKWYQFIDGWNVIENPPKPSGKWTGVGTRDLYEDSQQKIINLFN